LYSEQSLQHSSAVSGRLSYPGTSASPQKSVLGSITEALHDEEEEDLDFVVEAVFDAPSICVPPALPFFCLVAPEAFLWCFAGAPCGKLASASSFLVLVSVPLAAAAVVVVVVVVFAAFKEASLPAILELVTAPVSTELPALKRGETVSFGLTAEGGNII
jgi:hypothetical protein